MDNLRAVIRKLVLATATKLCNEVASTKRLRSTSYLESSQQMYNWLIAPIKSNLEAQNREHLTFAMSTNTKTQN